MNDRFRTSDADRDRVAALLRDHFADGRLSADELDERLTATLNARTFGDLRRVLADLPGPKPDLRPAGGLPGGFPLQAAPAWLPRRHRGPRVMPLVALALILALLIPGTGSILVAVLQAVLLVWLAACLAGLFLAARFAHRVRRNWRSAQLQYRIQHWTDGYTRP